jgi:hypothetical protein
VAAARWGIAEVVVVQGHWTQLLSCANVRRAPAAGGERARDDGLGREDRRVPWTRAQGTRKGST